MRGATSPRSVLLVCAVLASVAARNTKMKEVFSWKTVDFAFPNDETRQTAILTGSYVTKNNLPLGLDVWKNRVFVTVPRWKAGVPATLTYAVVDPEGKTTSPRLIPYPDWESNKLPRDDAPAKNTTHVISVFRVQVDPCDRLWVMDTGLADITGTAKAYFKPQILIYDLNTDKLIKKHTFKASDLTDHSFFANINVDADKDDCANAFAYVPDLGGYGLIVYSLQQDDSWRVKHNFFHFDPLNGDYNVGGLNFQWTDGIFSFALSKRGADSYKTAYFHALSSLNEFAVSTKIIRNKTIASDSYYEYKLLGSRGPNTQSSASFLDPKTGVVFYTQVNRDGVGCWNSNEKTYTADNQALVVSDNETFIFPNDLKVDREDNLWVLTDKLPHFIYRDLDLDQVNYRIFRAPVKDMIKDTVCDKPTSPAVPTVQPQTRIQSVPTSVPK